MVRPDVLAQKVLLICSWGPRTYAEIMCGCEKPTNTPWKGRDVKDVLKRLIERGLLKREHHGVWYYMTPEEVWEKPMQDNPEERKAAQRRLIRAEWHRSRRDRSP